MQITVGSNSKSVAKRLGKKGKELSASVKLALFKTAADGINIIQDRTAKGKGYNGKSFDGYSKTYKAFRRKKGRSVTPDLYFRGNMMGAMTAKSNRKQAEIFFRGAEESKKAAFNDKSRPFFEFNRSEKEELSRAFTRYLK